MTYDKMNNYIDSIFNVLKMINIRAEIQKDPKLKSIGLMIYNYLCKLINDYNYDIKNLVITEKVDLVPIFEYIVHNKIELYDFETIEISDVDTSKNEDLEKFILTHIYYITQKNTL